MQIPFCECMKSKWDEKKSHACLITKKQYYRGRRGGGGGNKIGMKR